MRRIQSIAIAAAVFGLGIGESLESWANRGRPAMVPTRPASMRSASRSPSVSPRTTSQARLAARLSPSRRSDSVSSTSSYSSRSSSSSSSRSPSPNSNSAEAKFYKDLGESRPTRDNTNPYLKKPLKPGYAVREGKTIRVGASQSPGTRTETSSAPTFGSLPKVSAQTRPSSAGTPTRYTLPQARPLGSSSQSQGLQRQGTMSPAQWGAALPGIQTGRTSVTGGGSLGSGAQQNKPSGNSVISSGTEGVF